MLENSNAFYNRCKQDDIILVPSISERILNKPQPPTPSNSLDDDLFYRLQKENARLPPQVIILHFKPATDLYPPLLKYISSFL